MKYFFFIIYWHSTLTLSNKKVDRASLVKKEKLLSTSQEKGWWQFPALHVQDFWEHRGRVAREMKRVWCRPLSRHGRGRLSALHRLKNGVKSWRARDSWHGIQSVNGCCNSLLTERDRPSDTFRTFNLTRSRTEKVYRRKCLSISSEMKKKNEDDRCCCCRTWWSSDFLHSSNLICSIVMCLSTDII